MKLVMTLLVRDEADILSSNLEFHLHQGVDYFIAMDNLSEDGTTAILREYEQRGVLRYIHQPDDDYNQSSWVTAMARLANSECSADWVINSDADEFWFADNGNLKDALVSIPASCQAVEVDRVNFLPVLGEFINYAAIGV